MATQQSKDKSEDQKPPLETQTADVQVAEKKNLDGEGAVRALRDDAGRNQLAGSEPQVGIWEASEDGKQFLADEKDRVKKDTEAAKAAAESLDKDGLSEADKKYTEVTGS